MYSVYTYDIADLGQPDFFVNRERPAEEPNKIQLSVIDKGDFTWLPKN